ncbi:hypothetical protein J8I87_41860 [Paraburkholderia sp. LEh10]|nr:hypothetical protein [Paraburkholderia sp. LEh10]
MQPEHLKYFGYFGTSSIDVDRQIVTHHVEGSCFQTTRRAITNGTIVSRMRNSCWMPTPHGVKCESYGNAHDEPECGGSALTLRFPSIQHTPRGVRALGQEFIDAI